MCNFQIRFLEKLEDFFWRYGPVFSTSPQNQIFWRDMFICMDLKVFIAPENGQKKRFVWRNKASFYDLWGTHLRHHFGQFLDHQIALFDLQNYGKTLFPQFHIWRALVVEIIIPVLHSWVKNWPKCIYHPKHIEPRKRMIFSLFMGYLCWFCTN